MGFLASTVSFTTSLQQKRNFPPIHPFVIPGLSFPADHHHSAVATTTTIQLGTTSTSLATAPSSFEPVLNIPAFLAFTFIATVFGLLQLRVRQIEDAVGERQDALERLRAIKAAQLANNNNTNDVEALDSYAQAYWKVERLRTLAPGIRIRAVVENEWNERGAQQFLGIVAAQQQTDKEEESSSSLAPNLAALLLGFIALSQIGLLFLFATTDPMGGGGVASTSFNSM